MRARESNHLPEARGQAVASSPRGGGTFDGHPISRRPECQ